MILRYIVAFCLFYIVERDLLTKWNMKIGQPIDELWVIKRRFLERKTTSKVCQ